jgi:DNA invertase Pin-like site-specific DNA recombinase
VRVSSRGQERDGTSLPAQRDEIERYCASAGLPSPILHVEVESAGAEHLSERGDLRALLDDARPGDVVIVTKQDRLTRSTLDFLHITADLTARGVGFLSLAERFDPATPAGRFAATIMAAVAEQELSRIRERTVGRRAEMREQGLYAQGRAPFGYRRGDREKREHLKLFIEPTEAALVREMFGRCIRGDSLDQIGTWMRIQIPARPWSPRVCRWMLTLRVYLGEIATLDGQRETHEPIVDRATFEAARTSLASRRKGGRRAEGTFSRDWILRGLATCALCGATMGTMYGRKKNSGVPTGYYACVRRTGRSGVGRCTSTFSRVPESDAAAAALALARLIEIRHVLTAPAPERPDVVRTDGAAARDRLRKKRERLVGLAADDAITRADLRIALAKLDTEAGVLAAVLEAEDRAAHVPDPAAADELIANVEALAAAWGTMPGSAKRDALRELAVAVTLGPEGPRPIWRTADELLAQPSTPTNIPARS